MILKLDINELVQKIERLIPVYSRKFHISLDGSRLFLKLAIIEAIKTIPKLDIPSHESSYITGDESEIKVLKKEIENWDENEFDLEDFEVIGYCKNIR